jgi:predicted DCC family thiol-disulfide oxidoreductase YuxK
MNELNVSDFLMISQNVDIEPGFKGTFEVFYDGQCPLCNREIEMVRRKDTHQRLQLTDIAAPGFYPVRSANGKSLDELMRQIHGRLPNGDLVTGPDVFRQIYGRLGFQTLVSVSAWPLVRQLIDAGYWVFAALRYRHALHRMRRSGTECDRCTVTIHDTPPKQASGHCEISEN